MSPSETTAPCPSEDDILAFLEGTLATTDLTSLTAHLDECTVCRRVLEAVLDSPVPGRGGTPVTVPIPGAHVSQVVSPSLPTTAPRRTFAPGDVVADRYRVREFLGAGGMGQVFAADDTVIGGRVALKVLAASVADDPDALARLKREVRLARLITHPNVCRVYDLGFHGVSTLAAPVAFLTMELIEGESLGRRIRRDGRLKSDETAALVMQMVDALEAAHRAGVTHRDFKSDNLMLAPGPDGTRAVVTDFGLAYSAVSSRNERLTLSSRAAIGTAAYMAPEQLDGSPITAATDFYALGIVIFEMLTGELPFKGPSPMAAATKRLIQPPPPLARHVRDIDPLWEEIVAGCLQRDARKRLSFAHTRARTALKDLLTKAGTPSLPSRGSRRRLLAVMGGLGILGVLTAAGVAIKNGNPSTRRVDPAPSAPPPSPAPVAISPVVDGTVSAPTAGLATETPVARDKPAPVEDAPRGQRTTKVRTRRDSAVSSRAVRPGQHPPEPQPAEARGASKGTVASPPSDDEVVDAFAAGRQP